MKACKGMEMLLHTFLTLTLNGNEWSESDPWTRGWVDPEPAWTMR